MSYGFNTLAIHAGQSAESSTGSVIPPIFQTTTFAQTELGGSPEYSYSRTGNPSRHALEENLAALEGARFGFAFASGLAAATAILQTLNAGDHVVATQDLYGGCYRLLTKVFTRLEVTSTFVDATDLEAIQSAITPTTRLLWLETPSNPLLKLTDLRVACELAQRRGVVTLVDNTFATPVFQQPLRLGADIVLHSTTKYIGGHCDALGGALITDNRDIAEQIRFVQNATGAVPSPLDCFLLLRGIKTLELRVCRHAKNALTIAHWLETHPEVKSVIYPGLPSHPQHALAQRQLRGFGSVISVEFEGGRQRLNHFPQELRLWTLAESLGGVKSLWCHPASMTHAAVEPAERARVGIRDGLVRLSVGLEDADDLIHDLDRALVHTRHLKSSVQVAEEVSV